MTSLCDLAELCRAPAALSVPGDVVAGAAAAGRLGTSWHRIPGLAAASVCLYWAGMAANDWADRDVDARERPERPIPSGRVSPATAFGVAAGLTAAGVALAGLAGGRRALAVAVPLAGTVWAYDLRLKQTPAGPATMATCRALDVLLGATGGRMKDAVVPALTVFAHTYTVTALSRSEVDGATPALPTATLAGTAAIAASAAAPPRSGARRWLRAVVGAGLSAWYARAYGAPQLKAVDKPSAGNIRAAVGSGIVGLPTLQGALTARAGAPVTGLAVAAAAPLGRRLARKLSPT
jgi:4-hydroxybenzoate polyprenyltransferase